MLMKFRQNFFFSIWNNPISTEKKKTHANINTYSVSVTFIGGVLRKRINSQGVIFFYQKIQFLEKYYFEITFSDFQRGLQKLGIILENNVFQQLMKNVNNKKCSPQLIFLNDNHIQKDSDNFWHWKFTFIDLIFDQNLIPVDSCSQKFSVTF